MPSEGVSSAIMRGRRKEMWRVRHIEIHVANWLTRVSMQVGARRRHGAVYRGFEGCNQGDTGKGMSHGIVQLR